MWIIRGNNMTGYKNYYAIITEDEVRWTSLRDEATQWPNEQQAIAVMKEIRSRKKRMCVERY